jgi:Ca2+-binding RTX toxin-like protein
MFQTYRKRFARTVRRRTIWLGLLSSVIAVASLVEPGQAALVVGSDAASILFGRDEDNVNNPAIQPAGVTANQSLNNTDVLVGRSGNDVIVGLLGSDVISSGGGNDILMAARNKGRPRTATCCSVTMAMTSTSGRRATAAISSSAAPDGTR